MSANVLPSIRPLTTRLLRPFLGRAALAGGKVETWQVAPAETAVAPKAYFLDGQLDRITGCQEDTTLETQRAIVAGGKVEHDEIRAFLLRDAHLIAGQIYAGMRRYAVSGAAPALFGRAPTEHFGRCALAASGAGIRYFGHWLTDDCATGFLEPEVGPMVSMDNMAWTHVRQYRELFDRRLPVVESAAFDELIVLKDYSQGTSKRRRYEAMRSALGRVAGRRKGHGVFVLRGRHGAARYLENEMELAETLARRGFDILDPMATTVEDAVATMKDAAFAVGVEGSNIYHPLFAIAGTGAIVCLIPPDRFNNVTKNITDCIGMKYGFLIGTGTRDAFHIDGSELMRTLDLVA
jgi:hypothetical protein